MDSVNYVNIGIDLGKKQDSTAICIAECVRIAEDKQSGYAYTEYNVRHIERLPLHLSYVLVADKILKILCSDILADKRVHVYVDITGVGSPVYDMIVNKIEWYEYNHGDRSKKTVIQDITFTYGKEYNDEKGSLGKSFMVSRLQSLLQNGRIHAPDTDEVQALMDELRVYEIRVSDAGNDTYGAISGAHDDLVTSLGLACLEDPYSNGSGGGMLILEPDYFGDDAGWF